jgi:hypothetical protein
LPLTEQPSAAFVSQATQLAPLTAQVAIVGLKHAVPEQHPDAHEYPSQTHAPSTQRWPSPHTA